MPYAAAKMQGLSGIAPKDSLSCHLWAPGGRQGRAAVPLSDRPPKVDNSPRKPLQRPGARFETGALAGRIETDRKG